MKINRKILGLIIARKGSKGLKNKNTKIFRGKPLVKWTFEAAKKSKLLNHVIVSTDSNKIIKLAKQTGVDAPFVRPKNLSTSNADIKSVIYHTTNWLKKNRSRKYDYLMLLQATSPFRTNKHIDNSIKHFFKLSNNKNETLVSVSLAPKKTSWIMQKKGKYLNFVFNKRAPFRQMLPNYYMPNGAIFICNLSKFKKSFYSNKVISYVMNKTVSLDIDDLQDFKKGLYK